MSVSVSRMQKAAMRPFFQPASVTAETSKNEKRLSVSVLNVYCASATSLHS